MHHSLLPPADIRALKTEYRVRLLTVFLFFVSFALVVGAVSLLPVFLSVTANERELAHDAAAARQDVATGTQAVSAALAQAASTVSLLSSSVSPALSGIVEKVAAYQEPGISLTSFDLARTGATSSELSVKGVAATRDDLVDFEKRMQSDPVFSGATAPISYLAPDADLQFTIQASAADRNQTDP